MRYGALTDPGCLKSENEDTLLVLPDRRIFGICDGMGGMNQGGFASRYIVDQLLELTASHAPTGGDRPVAEAVREASRRLHELARRSRGLFWTGTTLVLAHLADGLELVHAGDSRAYALRRRMVPLTRDHNLVEEMGMGEDYPHARSMTRYMGQRDLVPEVRRLRWTRPARLLLCSDGVNKELSDPEIEAALAGGSPEEACARLVEAARAAGGRDNISVVVVDGP